MQKEPHSTRQRYVLLLHCRCPVRIHCDSCGRQGPHISLVSHDWIDAPVMQKLVEPTMESPAPNKLGPAIAFTFQKPTPMRPPSTKNFQTRLVQIPSKRPLETDMDTERVLPGLDPTLTKDVPSLPTQNEDTTRPKPKKIPKPVSKCLLASLFETTVKLDSAKRLPGKQSTKTNTTDIAGQKVENWYVSNRARLDPNTRRLMVLAKPATPRQTMQLKAMRKHHWECGEEVKEALRRHRPASYSLRILRDRIDWCKVAPYVTLMIQAVTKKTRPSTCELPTAK